MTFQKSYRVITHEPKPTAPAPLWPHQAPTQKVPRGRWPLNSRANHSKASNQPANRTTRPAAVGGSRGSSAIPAPPGGKDPTAVFQRRIRTGEKRPQGEVRTVTIEKLNTVYTRGRQHCYFSDAASLLFPWHIYNIDIIVVPQKIIQNPLH